MAALVAMGNVSFSQAVGTYPGCPGAFGPTKLVMGSQRTVPSYTITQNTTWVKDTIYILRRFVNVAPGVTLTINAGTIVMGYPGYLDTSALMINRGAKINALGTSTNPVVFTSCYLQGGRDKEQWGGVIIAGNAPTNGILHYPGMVGNAGGSDSEDNSGTIQFARIEYAGKYLDPSTTSIYSSGLTFLGVGAKTVVQNVQVSNSNGDSFRWWGGTMNARNIISWKCSGSDFKTSFGFNGMLQFGIGYRDYSLGLWDDFSSNGIMSSNYEGSYFQNNSPTFPSFSNFELFGPLMTATAPYNKFIKRGAFLLNGS
jgi:hypothetical protein